ncbi:regulatory YrvL family protein [Bacillus sp. YC2]|uniref:YrvL family regulatory protein n=1 Tax=Bacillus sp. YC2 TaxID=2861287 RepID=UPI001CA63289|nr:YrvL family regulatory protein [Bacillus sp. YC2]MBY8914243.1 regulatory YrvL family protein [Bacillus sp. YC2]
MSKEDLPFKKLNLKTKLVVIIGISLILLAAFIIFAFPIFFGVTGFFKLFGVTYESNTSILLFILLAFLIGSIFDFIGKILVTMTSITIKNKMVSQFVKFVVDFLMNLITLNIVDKIMSSVFIPQNVLLIAAALLALMEAVFDDQKSRKTP